VTDQRLTRRRWNRVGQPCGNAVAETLAAVGATFWAMHVDMLELFTTK
jgi:hypothetical protein